jgi:hypothetical protein
MTGFLCIAFGFSTCLSITSSFSKDGGQNAAAFAMSIDDFAQLRPDEQRGVVIDVMRYRLQHGQNLQYEARRTMRLHHYVDSQGEVQELYTEGGSLGDSWYQGITAVNRRWQLGDSYRLDTDTYGRKGETSPRRYLVTGFDAEAGSSRSTRQTVGNKRSYGRIDVTHNELTEHDRYRYWLDGEHTTFGEHLFRYVVDHQSEATVEALVEDGLVRVHVPWQPFFSNEWVGTRQFFLDPERGFFPVRGYGKREVTRSDGSLSWRRETFFVEDAKLVGDVWMPTKLVETSCGSTSQPNTVTVYETEILSIEHGTVTTDDLIVPFKEGMEIVDAIEGVAYVAGADGTPKPGSIEGLIGAEAITAIPQPTTGKAEQGPTSSRTWLVLINIGVLLIIVAIYFLRRIGAQAG